jgi:hypothetical protein
MARSFTRRGTGEAIEVSPLLKKGQEAKPLAPLSGIGQISDVAFWIISVRSCLDSLADSRDNCAVIERKHSKLRRGFWMIITAVAFWFWLGTLNPVPPPAPGRDQPQPGQTR